MKKKKPLTRNNPPFRLALAAMPWHLFNRPSIQLGALKAFLEKANNLIKVESLHPYLEVARKVGPENYHWISQNAWGCDALYAPLLYPQQTDTALELAKKKFKKKECPVTLDLDHIRTLLKEQLQSWINSVAWHDFDLVGFSVCCNQLVASLAAAKLLKKSYPEIPIVFGGSSCTPDMTKGLLAMPQIDHVISGEGEQPLLALCLRLMEENEQQHGGSEPNNKRKQISSENNTCQLADLASISVPDYSGYFKEMQHWFVKAPFIPVLPIEFSRGCWWGKCAFCNLNQQWKGYRAKSPDQVLHELQTLSQHHACLDFAFTDNALPLKDSVRLFRKLATKKRDYHFFAEIRATQRRDLPIFRKGGMTSAQAGIEALSESLLKKMQKGVSVIENIAMMKTALENDIELDGNLITEFPGSSREEIKETVNNLDFVLPFKPLRTAAFFLGHGSPVDRSPDKFGIHAILPHHNNARLFPKDILSQLPLLIKEYRGDRTLQRKLWTPVVRKVKQWQEFHQQRSQKHRPALSYRDGGEYIIIRQEHINGQVLHHRLHGASREIHLACADIINLDALLASFPNIQKKKMVQFLKDLIAKRLLFGQGEKYLSLAVRYS